MELIQTSRGGQKLIRNNFMYIKNAVYKDGDTTRWVCSGKKKYGCNGSLTTDKLATRAWNIKAHSGHNADNVKVEIEKVRRQMKETAKQNSGSSTARILTEGLQSLSPNALAHISSNETLKRDIQRQKASNRPDEPANIRLTNLIPP